MAAKYPALEPLSAEHRQVLQLCENIRIGLRNNIPKKRIRTYTNWFKTNFLDPHFELEEQHIFPLLGNNVRVKKALANHRRIHKLLSCDCDNERVLNLLEEELATYIRFEERVLYKELAQNLHADDLEILKKYHANISFSEEAWKDKFWLS
ncbi:hemerythrin domain-containing protein [Salinimicrobium tongyeongense]|uniref:Hemerythrin domain-containing protein n=1 Tax=Salinimicrobium tongyeongense TaxID=2809707 RepID=A0ABY6NS42_9FLAO|nr:hemerythrin domain-containing protein [Salinimicrobium tongyeongense]UZH55381.1 hemerythrin domain-containing protein [Salinimicrobium tongyeongense]